MTNDMTRKVTNAEGIIKHLQDSLFLLRVAERDGDWQAVEANAARIATDSHDLSLSLQAIG